MKLDKKTYLNIIISCLILGLFTIHILPFQTSAQTSCPVLPTDKGMETLNTTIPTQGTYKIWSRLKPSSSDASANSYFLQFGTQCAVKIGDRTSDIPIGAWTWVDFKDGATTQKVSITLPSGSQVVKLIGNEAGVGVDKIIILDSANSCIPTGIGDNCNAVVTLTPTTAVSPTSVLATPTPTRTPTPTPIQASPTPTSGPVDLIKPTISITNPLNGSFVQRRSTVTISSSANDNIAVDHVTFSAAGNTSTDYSAPYQYSWSVGGKPNASYTITAKAFDTSNNSATTSVQVTSQ